MQHAEAVSVGGRGDQHVDRWKAVVADARDLSLRVQYSLLDVLVDREVREGKEFLQQLVVVSGLRAE